MNNCNSGNAENLSIAGQTNENENTLSADSTHNEMNINKETVKKPYYFTDDEIYLSVIDSNGSLSFAYLKDNEINFGNYIEVENKKIIPPSLPKRNGEVKSIVGIPNKSYIRLMDTLDATELKESIIKHLNKYIDAPESEIELFTYYIIFTWFYNKTNTVPYLRMLADTGKGKSRFLTVIADLCFYNIKASGASSATACIRFNENWHGTLEIDESDIDGGADNSFIKYLNSGFEAHKYFLKCKSNNYEEQEVFDPFCPKVIAMRKPFKDNATEGRVISVTPRETNRKDISMNLPKKYYQETEILRALISRFVLFNWKNVDGDMNRSFGHLNAENRIKQMILPMSLICQLFPDGEELLEEYVEKRQKEVKKERSESFEGAAFNYVYSLAIGEEKPTNDFIDYVGNAGLVAVTPSMAAKGLSMTSRKLTEALKSIGMISESNRVLMPDGRKVSKRYYAVPDENTWQEIIQRYWYQDSGSDSPSCPEALKSKQYK